MSGQSGAGGKGLKNFGATEIEDHLHDSVDEAESSRPRPVAYISDDSDGIFFPQ